MQPVVPGAIVLVGNGVSVSNMQVAKDNKSLWFLSWISERKTHVWLNYTRKELWTQYINQTAQISAVIVKKHYLRDKLSPL